MKSCRYSLSVIFFVLLIINSITPLFSQEVNATYDVKTGMLTIEKHCKNIVQIRDQKVIESVYNNPENDLKSQNFNEINAYLLEGENNILRFKIPLGAIKAGDQITYYKQEGENFKTPANIEIKLISKTAVNSGFEIQQWMYYAAAAALLLLILILYFLFRKKKSVETPIKPEENKFEVIEDAEDTPDYSIGLDGVRHEGGNYYIIDAQQIYYDTALHKIYISRFAIKTIYDSLYCNS